VIAKSGSSLLAIINDILDFSKIEAGKLELEKAPVDMADVVEDVLSLFWERARSKDLDLAAFVDPAVPALIAADETRLRQVIGNLVNNAIKFTEKGGVLVHIAPDPQGLRVTVHDTGIGIAPDKLSTVFGAFSQADQSTTRKFGGTGLGLAISKRLVETMQGRMAVASELGKGSSFAFIVPVEVIEPAEPWPAAGEGLQAAVGLSGRCTRWAIEEYLKRAGMAPGGLDASAEDLALNVVDPDHLAQARRRAPIVCVSEYADVISARQSGEARPDAALIQPFRRKELRAVLAQLAAGEPVSIDATSHRGAGGEALPRFDGARALVADDSAVNREVAAEALSRLGVRTVQVEDGRAAVEAAMAEAFDIVLMDGSMPELDGYEATRALRSAEAEAGRRPVPVVCLTAHVVGSAADAWREAGMDGVLHKPFTLASLARTLGQFLEPSGEAVAEGAAAPAPAAEGELFDPRVQADMAAMDDKGGFVTRIRNLYRQHAPETLNRLKSAAAAGEAEDMARAAHALKSMSLNMGAALVARLSSGLEGEGRAGRVPLEQVSELEAAVSATLDALGGDAQPGGDAALSDRDLVRMLTHALRADEFCLAYQPQFDREGVRIVGVEALLRWTPKDGAPIPPNIFIPAAERNGLIPDVTEWMMAHVMAETVGLGLPVAVNASALEFGSDRFYDMVTRTLEATGFDPKRLEIEITETAIIQDEAQVRATIERLHALGVKVALDDFGAGYSSLSHLLRFPFDKLKIDKSFIDACSGDIKSASVIHGVVSIGRSLGMKVVAEGVETPEQHGFLKAAGVHALQGYLFQRPAPIAAIVNLVSETRLAS
jgi:EAL domain-containing protein (putative c-di-GMP-specific phosphodiesterase class I)/CheY-like chemotaxis protein